MAEKRSVTFDLEGPPQGKGRARSTASGRHYTPDKTVSYETRLAWTFRQAAPSWVPLAGPVRIMVTAVFNPPQSITDRQRREIAAGNLFPTVKPDLDNVLKIVADGLNGIAYIDDKQIVRANLLKVYRTDIPAKLTITISEEC